MKQKLGSVEAPSLEGKPSLQESEQYTVHAGISVALWTSADVD
jgi:hypothetical protein